MVYHKNKWSDLPRNVKLKGVLVLTLMGINGFLAATIIDEWYDLSDLNNFVNPSKVDMKPENICDRLFLIFDTPREAKQAQVDGVVNCTPSSWVQELMDLTP